MAKVIRSTAGPQTISSTYSIIRMLVIGAIIGIVYWLLALLLVRVLENGVAGDVATIIAAVIGVALLIKFNIGQPLVVAVASAFSLWGLARIMAGISWAEFVGWTVLLYAVAYLLFSWLTRYVKVTPVLLAIALIVIVIRIIVGV